MESVIHVLEHDHALYLPIDPVTPSSHNLLDGSDLPAASLLRKKNFAESAAADDLSPVPGPVILGDGGIAGRVLNSRGS